ncbi:unnamed protein product [Trichogramma brassicae]|uniref:Uncharacterized protein n=1 Tax=Trichogramma brassicae TaxID=86971 RepID=A0A6H5HVJ7_9HYME|nr:unnamed protein product [Trichogramma brassicae]
MRLCSLHLLHPVDPIQTIISFKRFSIKNTKRSDTVVRFGRLESSIQHRLIHPIRFFVDAGRCIWLKAPQKVARGPKIDADSTGSEIEVLRGIRKAAGARENFPAPHQTQIIDHRYRLHTLLLNEDIQPLEVSDSVRHICLFCEIVL